ncbi:hemerythrin domain-containing protein [Nocardioides pacificus]
MCHYCGCRQIPLIRDYIAEHEQVTELADHGLRALDEGERAVAADYFAQMVPLLRSHWQGEEEGVFKVMAETEELYADYIEPLMAEHRELDAFLVSLDLDLPEHRERIRREMVELGEHISREEDGLFPPTLTTLDGPQWDEAIAAWQRAHPGRQLIAD